MKNYSFIQKYLHHFVLKKTSIKKSLFYLETFIFNLEKDIENEEHLFITGMPRAGTTTLLNFFFETDQFASLTYNDMPFVLSPNLFGILPKKKIESKERSHKDGIVFDNYSPECFDEVFFLTFNKEEILQNISKYISLVLKKYSKNRYLSKNNNNYMRIDILTKKFPNSKILIMYRDPLKHAQSLLKSHKNFCNIQKNDKFIEDYMSYLGHFEFGLNYKPRNKPIKFNNHFSIDHWLEQWCLFYENLISREINRNVIFVSYDDLCKDKDILQKLCKINKLDKEYNFNYFNFKTEEKKEIYSKEIYKDCYNTFDKLNNLKSNVKNIDEYF